MPVGVCSLCQRRFVVEGERSFQRTCPGCLRPMQVAPPQAARPGEPPGQTLSCRATLSGEFEGMWLAETPLPADELGQRLMAALAEAAYQRSLAQDRRRAEQKGSEACRSTTEEFLTPAPPVAPDARRGEQNEAVRKVEASPLTPCQRAMLARQQAAVIFERAREAEFRAKQVCGKTRVLLEDLRSSRDRLAPMPSWDYVLPSLAAWQPPLTSEDEEASSRPKPSLLFDAEPPTPTISTTFYVWGHEPPRSFFCREQLETSEAAAQYAARSGWEASQPGAWVGEITLPLDLRETLQTLERIVRQDPGVAGWGIRMQRGCRDTSPNQ